MKGNTDQAVRAVAEAIAVALRKLDPSIQVVEVSAPEGEDGVVRFLERDTDREWYVAVQLDADPTLTGGYES